MEKKGCERNTIRAEEEQIPGLVRWGLKPILFPIRRSIKKIKNWQEGTSAERKR